MSGDKAANMKNAIQKLLSAEIVDWHAQKSVTGQ